MGGSTTKQTSNQQQTASTTLPPWLTDAAQSTFGQAKATSDANPVKAYTAPMAAPMAANQYQAGTQAAATATTGQADLDQARALTARAAGGTTPQVTSANFDGAAAKAYMSPYTGEVQQATLGEMRRQNQIQDDGLRDQAQAAHAYGGTRQAVQEAEQSRGQNANMLDYLARSNADAFTQAQGQFNQDRASSMQAQTANQGAAAGDLNRTLEAAGTANSTAGAATGTNTDNIMNLLRTGQIDQDTANKMLGGDYNEFLRMQDAPVQRQGDLMAMLTGAPRNVTTSGTSNGSSTTKSDPGLMNMLLAGGQIAASAFSDRRLKRDITFLGRMANGLGVYLYRYVWDPLTGPRRTGVMADEVRRLAPHALGRRIHGFDTVDYSKLWGAF